MHRLLFLETVFLINFFQDSEADEEHWRVLCSFMADLVDEEVSQAG